MIQHYCLKKSVRVRLPTFYKFLLEIAHEVRPKIIPWSLLKAACTTVNTLIGSILRTGFYDTILFETVLIVYKNYRQK